MFISDPDRIRIRPTVPGSLRIRIWIRNTASISLNAAPDEIFELFYQKEFFGSKV